jgi:hypothetical protein
MIVAETAVKKRIASGSLAKLGNNPAWTKNARSRIGKEADRLGDALGTRCPSSNGS